MQVSLLHEHGLRDHSISSHSATRRVALSRYPEGHGCHARASNLGRFEVFTPGSMGGQTSPFASRLIEHAKPNRVRRPLQRTFYGLVRHLLLLSTSPHGDAVAVGYRSENEYLGKDLHLPDRVRSQAHWRKLPACGDGRVPVTHQPDSQAGCLRHELLRRQFSGVCFSCLVIRYGGAGTGAVKG